MDSHSIIILKRALQVTKSLKHDSINNLHLYIKYEQI